MLMKSEETESKEEICTEEAGNIKGNSRPTELSPLLRENDVHVISSATELSQKTPQSLPQLTERLAQKQLSVLQTLSNPSIRPKIRVTLIDARSNYLTITWPAFAHCKNYTVIVTCENKVLRSLKVKEPHAQIGRLKPNQEYFCRVTAEDDKATTAITHEHAFRTLSISEDNSALMPPATLLVGGRHILVSWKHKGSVDLGYRECVGGAKWKSTTVDSKHMQIKITTLECGKRYQFRVRPSNKRTLVSPPSKPILLHSRD